MQYKLDIDSIDHQILQNLRANGRITNLELAERVALSPSACLRRVQELERKGVIRGYRATLDGPSLGVHVVAYVTVGLSRHTLIEQKAFEEAMAAAPQVRECHNVTGAVEYILRVEVADLAAYKRFHSEVLGALTEVATITSYIVMDSPKDERA
jgi:DNA-binding Lrp family transcriptional regulator